jgi:transposase
MTPQEVLSIHHSLWQIEESFRISKSLLNARPCFHWSDNRIKGHFLICYLALVMFRLLEADLEAQGVKLSAEQITDALRNASVTAVALSDTETAYFKIGTEGEFQEISQAMGLGTIPRMATPQSLKAALRVKEL